jgi:hypothetical protein
MARPRKLTRDPDKKPRSFDELQRIHQMAEKLYHLTGGGSIDNQLAALDRTQDAFRSQMDAAEIMQSDVGAGAWGPNVSIYESRMAASTAAKLHKLKEQKMAQCLLWAEEGAEAAANAAKTEETVPEARDRSPQTQEPPAPDDGEQPKNKRPVATAVPEDQIAAKDGAGSQKREQSPLAPKAVIGGASLTALPPRR